MTTTFKTPYGVLGTTNAVDAQNPLNFGKALRLIGKEVWNFVLIQILTVAILGPILVSAAIIVTGGNAGARVWGSVAAVLLPLACYAFFVSRSGKHDKFKRLAAQWLLFTGAASLGLLITPTSGPSLGTVVLSASFGGVLALGMAIGGRFVSKTTKAKKKKHWVTSLLSAILGISIGLGLVIGGKMSAMALNAKAEEMMYVGKEAPATKFKSADGSEWSLSDHKGKVILLEYWSPNCGACLVAFSDFKNIQERFGADDDFVMASVTISQDRERSSQLFRERGGDWQLLFDAPHKGPHSFNPNFVPAAYIIGRDGIVVAADLRGPAVERELEQVLAR